MARELTHGEKAVQPKNALPSIDETVPGGHYIGEDGEPHDAEGNKVTSSKARAAHDANVEHKEKEVKSVEAPVAPVVATSVAAKKEVAKKAAAKKSKK